MIAEEVQEFEQLAELPPPDIRGPSAGAYPLKKRLQDISLTPDAVAILQESIMHPIPTADEEQEDIQPEFMAALIHTEERGVALATPPTHLYNVLFPEEKQETVIDVR